jgi:hypothetical protein
MAKLKCLKTTVTLSSYIYRETGQTTFGECLVPFISKFFFSQNHIGTTYRTKMYKITFLLLLCGCEQRRYSKC